MKKYLLLALTLIIGVTNTWAQDEEVRPKSKPTVFIESFTGVNSSNAVAVRNAFIAGMANVGRIEMIDAQSEGVAANEELRRTSNNISAGDDNVTERLGAIVRLGAEYYVKGNIDALSVSHKTSTLDKKNQAVASIIITLKLIDPNTGRILNTEQVTFEETNSDNNESKAMTEAIAGIKSSSKVEYVIDKFFPIEGQLIDVDQAKKDAATFVYINAGTLHGINKSLKLEVFTVKKVAGREARKKIGELRVEEIQGEDLSYCKVKSGGKEILEKFKAGEKLVVKSRPEESTLGKLLRPEENKLNKLLKGF